MTHNVGKRVPRAPNLPSLNNGDHMQQPEFHRLYEAMPEGYRAELIGGVVFEPSPVSYEHSVNDGRLSYLLHHYAALTPGLESGGNGTVILGPEDEVQPDVMLRIKPGFGGQSRNVETNEIEYIEGAPELVAEVAYSTRAIDLHLKKTRYKVAGVLEYIVLCIRPLELHWFSLQSGSHLQADEAGIIKSKVFPGLWLDVQALLSMDYKSSMQVLNAGMQTPEYQEYSRHLSSKIS